ncbi:MAG: hypothetical protein ACUVQX_05820 [Candidatus Bathycorpusculaceae bacterium]
MFKSKVNVLATVATLIVASIFTRITLVQASEEMQQFFSEDYPGISIIAEATRETVPNEGLTLKLWINCTARGVKIEYLNLSVYGFADGKDETLLNSTQLMNDKTLELDEIREEIFNITVPGNVWGSTFAEISLKYSIMGKPLPDVYPSFPMTFVRFTAYEELQMEYAQFRAFYAQLNQTFFENFKMNLTLDSLASLNNTFRELQGRLGELNITRTAVGVLAVIAFFFVVTTLYLAARKPKQYW